MKPSRGNDEDDGGLDSLLDTMTNVVGILVLVLIVTQMSVAEVVTRITTENKVDEESVNLTNSLRSNEPNSAIWKRYSSIRSISTKKNCVRNCN